MVGSITLSLTAHNFALALHVIQFLLYRHRRGKNTTLFWVWLREKNSPSHPLFRRLCNLSFLIILRSLIADESGKFRVQKTMVCELKLLYWFNSFRVYCSTHMQYVLHVNFLCGN